LLASFGIAVPLSLIYIPSNFWGFWRILDGLTPHAGYATGRLSLWLTALKGIVASPWIGHGEDQFHYAITRQPWNHPHNSVLQFLYQWGIIGTSCVLVIVTPILARVRHVVSRYPDIILPALGPLCGLVMMSLLEGSLYHVFPLMVVIISLAVLASCSVEPIDSRAGATSPTTAPAVAPST
jgi:O-antigen ligase